MLKLIKSVESPEQQEVERLTDDFELEQRQRIGFVTAVGVAITFVGLMVLATVVYIYLGLL